VHIICSFRANKSTKTGGFKDINRRKYLFLQGFQKVIKTGYQQTWRG